jgi:hypothetical protein
MGQDGVKMVNKTAAQNLFLFDLKHILHNHFGNWVASGGKQLWLNTLEIVFFLVVRGFFQPCYPGWDFHEECSAEHLKYF